MPIYSGPKIEYVVPTNGSEGIGRTITVKVKFTNIMSSDTLTSDYIYLRPFGDTTQKIPCTVTIEQGDGQTILLDPNEPLSGNTKYEIVVVGQSTGLAIKNILDEPLIETYISSFTTIEEPVYIPPEDGGIDPPVVDKPFIISSYPKDGQFNVSPTSIKVKFNIDISTLNFVVGGNGTPGDFNLIEGEFLKDDLDDINILPVVYVGGTISATGNILEFIPIEMKNDTVYSIVFTGDKIDNTIITFQSEFSEFFGDIKLIKADLSKYIKISDSLLAKYVADISKDAYEIVNTAQGEDAVDWLNRPYYVDEYVRYKTVLELVNTKYIELTTASSMVQLGDFTVQNTISADGLSSFMDGLKIHMKKWDDALHGHSNRGYAKPAIVGKRETELNPGSGYPDYMDRRLKTLDGTKE